MAVEVKARNGGGGDQEREVAMEREVVARVAIEQEVEPPYGARGWGCNGARERLEREVAMEQEVDVRRNDGGSKNGARRVDARIDGGRKNGATD